ncbi:molybdopterin oxidoreductase family protein [Alteribacillus sp. JSM 102045]|uniref:molybdopterin oxidoreductase family protein n=1 Tax=Alteribacillus sp. JSM 102045 TaxID=1562101 RepID=UPI0035C18000
MEDYRTQPNGVFKSVCSLDCPDQCGLLLHKKEGKIKKVEGDPEHPVTKGAICNKVRHMTERIYDEKRIGHPLRRIGPKGEGVFEQISWEKAINIIALHWKKLIKKEGPESILPYSFYGNMGRISAEGMDRRFFHRLGASRLERTICSSAGAAGYGFTMGGSFGTDPEDTVHAKLFIMWGINAVSTNMHQVTLAQQARKKGAKIVVIDVHKNQTGRWGDWFIPIKPGTDAALALGMMHILFDEDLTDESFLKKYTVGYEELREHVKAYDPYTVSEITGVSVESIYELTRLYGQTTPSFIRIGNGIQHHDNGGMCVRTIACLPALTGQWLQKGGGAIKGNGSVIQFSQFALQRPDLLEKKSTRSINMNVIGKELLERKEPPIRSLYVYNSNPALVAPESRKVREGLEREDLFTVVHDMFVTETAKYADIILPASSSFETTDFYTSYWHHYMQLQRPVIENYKESKSNSEVFRILAESLGYKEKELFDTDESMIQQALENPKRANVEWSSLKQNHYGKAPRPATVLDELSTPSGKIELYSKVLEKLGHPPLPTYIPLKEENEPYLFVPGPNHSFLNSTFSNNEKHKKLEKGQVIHINKKDAEAKGIEDGDIVKIWNERGECKIAASVGENVLPGVVVSQGLWSDEEGSPRNVNALTPERLSDMGGGATFFSGRIHMEKV